ncbi:MAG: hypothetical protein JW944_02380 [Deltaproteobacteria bacterium]|nr:hypothetical protein [Deltaproteobacteria bacterium]
MTDEKDRKEEYDEEKKEKDWPLPNCTTAPSAEHFRANAEDEPCDDARGNVIEEKKDKA